MLIFRGVMGGVSFFWKVNFSKRGNGSPVNSFFLSVRGFWEQ